MNLNPQNNSPARDSISVIMPALNEECNLRPAVELVKEVINKKFNEYEIIIVNDGSTDKTPLEAEALAKETNNIYVIHHSKPQGLGAAYKRGLAVAKMNYYLMISADNEATKEQIENIISQRGKADMIIPYTINSWIRPLGRKILSRTFVFMLNCLFGLGLKYYNGAVLHKRRILNSIHINTDSFFYQAEALIKLINSGHSFLEVGIEIKKRGPGGSKALRLSNIAKTLKALISVYWEIRFKKKDKKTQTIESP
ncbi:MAG: glycosyltransferase family 2 protein [Candidatus Omnitrophica bacterium]|nr:glycosyltransferase family 2 protein [Candidatus Omnitrophota bacterium]